MPKQTFDPNNKNDKLHCNMRLNWLSICKKLLHTNTHTHILVYEYAYTHYLLLADKNNIKHKSS